jgi:phosphatidylethanolamine/phosphatidyl-N-methylethanolamine N-methyltransferase
VARENSWTKLRSKPANIVARKIFNVLSDTTLFLREWIAHPQRIGSIVPSSPRLAAAMAQWIPRDRDSYVLELGPGTGPVTEALLQRGLREDRLIAIEFNPALAATLQKKFPRAHIIAGDAWLMDELLQKISVTSVGAVISSLPLLNFSPAQAAALAGKIRKVLAPQGHFVQFSYQIAKKRTRGGDDFNLVASQLVWLNLPPARVSVYQK